jgi:hypothetical protein
MDKTTPEIHGPPNLNPSPQTNFSPPPDSLTSIPRKRYPRGSPRGLPRGEPINPTHGPPSHSPPFNWPDPTTTPSWSLPPGPPARQETKSRPPSAYLFCPFPGPPFTTTQTTSFSPPASTKRLTRPVPPMPKAPEEESNELTRYRYRRRLSSTAAHLRRERVKAGDFTAYSVGLNSSIGKIIDKTNSIIRRFFSN